RDLARFIRDGQFREDLYYRINVVEIELPPLRSRSEDIHLLVNHYLVMFAQKHKAQVTRFSQDALKAMLEYDWPGNVRELINVVERCVVLSTEEEIRRDILPSEIIGGGRPTTLGVRDMLEKGDINFQDAKHRVVQTFEREFFMEAVRMNNWNISQTANKLGMKRQYLQQKLKELELNIQEAKENI
ncbi:MAG TPA: helix-turn-helix domain-containing protein, partial [bacterium]|nr:helix-turn-helix domain-containing protein [bacterium]